MAESRLSVGNVEILALSDGEVDYPFPLTDVFPGTTEQAWAQYRQRYPEVFGGPNTWRAHWGCYLLRSQGRTVLVDTGVGSKATNPGTVATLNRGVDGSLMAQLQAVGVRSEGVDTVFFTHLHPDHVGWNLSQGGDNPRATFPRARYIVHKADWDTFGNPEIQAQLPFKFWVETVGPLETLGVLDLITGERALTNEITAIPTPGHTPGHMSLLVSSGAQRAVILGDVAIHPAQVTEADWYFAFELDQQQANRTRQEFFDRLAREGTTVAACHFPAPGFGKIVRIQGRRYWQAL